MFRIRFLFALLISTSALAQTRNIALSKLTDNNTKAQLASSLEVSYLTGVTSAIQTQINALKTPQHVLAGVTLSNSNISSAAQVMVIPAATIGAGRKFRLEGASMIFIGSTTGTPLPVGLGDCRLRDATTLKDFFQVDLLGYLQGAANPGAVTFPSTTPTQWRAFNILQASPTAAYWEGSTPGEAIVFQCPSSGVITCTGPGTPVCETRLQIWGTIE